MTIILSDLKTTMLLVDRGWGGGGGRVARGSLKHTCIAALHEQRDTVCT